DGKKIGEVRRDFQMLVYNVQGEDHEPVLVAEKANGQVYQDFVRLTDADFPQAGQERRCVSLKVTDLDIRQEDNFTERLSFRIIPQNFQDASVVQLSVQQGVVTAQQPELSLQFCLPECPPVFDEPYRFDVVAYDDVCSMPLTDTLRVEVALNIPPNDPAYILNIPNRSPIRSASYTMPMVQEGRAYDFEIEGYDTDGDPLNFNWVAQGFDAAQWGFSINPLNETLEPDGRRRVRYGVRWDAVCSSQRDFGQKNSFDFLFSLDDTPDCDRHEEATYLVNFSVNLAENISPDVRASLNNYQAVPPQNMLTEEVIFGDPLTFIVRASDPDQGQLLLRAAGKDFSLQEWGMLFEDVSGTGTVSGSFSWDPGCEQLLAKGKNEFILYFISQDAAECKTSLSDTITVQLRLRFPENAAPSISAHTAGEVTQSSPYEVNVGEDLRILLRGIDANQADQLFLQLTGIDAPFETISYSWQDASNTGGEVTSLLSFMPDCALLQGAQEALVTFNFKVSDSPCYDEQADTVAVQVLVRDRPQDWDRVSYVNFFSPNGDACNQAFEIHNLPEDACNNTFEYIRIYNRWGKLLYESNDRNFQWNGDGQPAGTYYYLLKYTGMTYRSPLTLVLGDQAGNDVLCP
ncbi:MAG: gliding motility-associated C-terminal domain-containing protein, partial [Bacteroidetes bacterium]|nr:gliding motility-associated C-terminal domain-containing protein [Bacteroidota bacterium]